jgi:SanA protein
MIRTFLYTILFIFVITALTAVTSFYYVQQKAKGHCFSSVDNIPEMKVGLLLGTSPYLQNRYFKNRITAAVALFKSKKIRHIIVSGDNHVEGYDEATAMKKALMNAGVPDSCITLDYAGFRTLDSIIRCREIFGQDEFTVISQEFHNERAVFIARNFGINAIGFNAEDVEISHGFKTQVREYFARVKCLMDLYVLHTEPHFLGEKINLNVK